MSCQRVKRDIEKVGGGGGVPYSVMPVCEKRYWGGGGVPYNVMPVCEKRD